MAIIRKNTTSARKADSRKASAFLNVYVSKRDGSRARLGSIPLRESNAAESSILKWIAGDASKAASLVDKFSMDYHSAESHAADFDFIDSIDESSETAESDVLGFLNLSLPTANGDSRFASIVLRAGNRNIEAIAQWLVQDEDNVEVMRSRLSIDYQSANPSKTVEFLLD